MNVVEKHIMKRLNNKVSGILAKRNEHNGQSLIKRNFHSTNCSSLVLTSAQVLFL